MQTEIVEANKSMKKQGAEKALRINYRSGLNTLTVVIAARGRGVCVIDTDEAGDDEWCIEFEGVQKMMSQDDLDGFLRGDDF